MNDLVFYIGAADAVIIGILGVVGAALIISGKDSEVYWQRVIPACAILIGTTIAAGIVMLVTQWLGS